MGTLLFVWKLPPLEVECLLINSSCWFGGAKGFLQTWVRDKCFLWVPPLFESHFFRRVVELLHHSFLSRIYQSLVMALGTAMSGYLHMSQYLLQVWFDWFSQDYLSSPIAPRKVFFCGWLGCSCLWSPRVSMALFSSSYNVKGLSIGFLGKTFSYLRSFWEIRGWNPVRKNRNFGGNCIIQFFQTFTGRRFAYFVCLYDWEYYFWEWPYFSLL